MAKKTAFYGVMLAVAMVFSYIEAALPLPIPVPGIKLGLANLAVIILLYSSGALPALFINVARIVLTGIIFGNIQSLIFGLCGGILSWGVMILCKHIKYFSLSGVSLCGGVAHSVGQIAAAIFVLSSPAVIYYLPFLALSGAVTGFLIGAAAALVLQKLPSELQKR